MFLVLSILHSILKRSVHEEIEEVFAKLQETASNDLKDKTIAQRNIAKYAIDIALSKNRKGKRRRRHEVIKSLHEIGFDSDNTILKEDTFLLSKSQRISMMLLFTILGFISLIVPIIEIVKKVP